MITPRGSKDERFTACFAEIEAGNILLPEDAPWLEALRRELKAFPTGRHDDQVDSVSQFVEYQLKNWRWILTENGRDTRPMRLLRERTRPW
jgi:predicted phage terminase large subunit-like protein